MKHLTIQIVGLVVYFANFATLSYSFTVGRQYEETLQCPLFNSSKADTDLSAIFPTFNFNSSWISRKYFWLSDDFDFESRAKSHFRNVRSDSDNLVRVIILPHSHNDPGWLNTYEQYYRRQTRFILDNAVQYLTDFPEMTFVWSEITYLARWWKDASPLAKEQLRNLIEEERFEIATGGWVVPDEATSSLYSLVTELTEGQQWVRINLNNTPKYSWAIDPFGHSSTHSHLLKLSNMKGMIIQRQHYVWKHWLAQQKMLNFRWRQRWDGSGNFDIPCHSLPYDLYSIKHACGPQPQVCLKYDFRSISFEYGENYGLMTPITKANVRKSAEEIAGQYHKTASLTNHNIILVPLGDDFRYDRSLEWQQQYANYMQLFSYINSHQDKFRMDIGFGTLTQYFEAVEEEYKNKLGEQQPSLSGDFYPYGDVYVSGEPSYWTGFYGTRPYWKKFHREVENELRSAEILFTYANIIAREPGFMVELKSLAYKYQELVTARQDFAVFTHHDGITGTSRRWTMDDYGEMLHTAYQNSVALQVQCLKIIYKSVNGISLLSPVTKDFTRDKFEILPEKMPLEAFANGTEYMTKLVVFNSLAWKRTEMIKVLVRDKFVKVVDYTGSPALSQINPVFQRDDVISTIHISDRVFELVFLADLEPLSFSTFHIIRVEPEEEMEIVSNAFASVTCSSCVNLNETLFYADDDSQTVNVSSISIENSENKLHFHKTGLLSKIEKRKSNISTPVALSFGFYKPVNKASGAYLLKPMLSTEWEYFGTMETSPLGIIKITGPVMSQVIALHVGRLETIIVNTTLINGILPEEEDSSYRESILVENFIDVSRDYSNRLEVFMRLDTVLKSSNGTFNQSHPLMYTDQNGLVSERRVTIPAVNYEGNTYPVTTMAYIQDEKISAQERKLRLSVLVDRTHGFCSMKEGRLETLVERKSLYDDGRGMSEGVTDSRPTISTYKIILENLEENEQLDRENSVVNDTESEADVKNDDNFSSWQPTLSAHRASLKHLYTPQLFVYTDGVGTVEETISLVSSPLPDNVHLFNFRTLSEDFGNKSKRNESRQDTFEKAGKRALLNLLFLPGRDEENERNCSADFKQFPKIEGAQSILDVKYLNVTREVKTSLTGIGKEPEENSNSTSKTIALLSSFRLHLK